jgi:hypothetical protein
MALSTSGYITLGDNITGRSIAKELNDGPPNYRDTISLGDTNVRALAQRTSGSISMSHLRGKSAAIDTQTVTVGYSAPAQYVPGGYGVLEGGLFSNTPPKIAGSISDGTTNVKNGFRITALYWAGTSSSSTATLFWTILCGTSVVANNGFTTMTVNGNNFARSAATFTLMNTAATTGIAQWTWNNVTNPFGTTTGVSRTVTWS